MALAEAGGKRRSLSGGVEVREIAEAGHAEDGSARLALFAGDDGDAAGQRDGVVPEDDRGAVEQAREKHAFDAEVAEQEQVFRVRTDGGVEVVAALVATGGKQAVKVFRDAPVDHVDAGSFIGGSVHPALRVIIHGARASRRTEENPSRARGGESENRSGSLRQTRAARAGPRRFSRRL